MRFLLTADLHIGCSRTFLPSYLQRQESMLDEIYSVAVKEKVDAVTVAGDVFDSADTTHAERDMFLRKVLAFDSLVPFLVIPGNHDLVDTQATTLHYLSLLSKAGKFKQSHIVEHTTLVQVGDTLFVLLVAHGSEFRRELKRILTEIRESSIQLDHKNLVVIAHQTVKGSLTATGYRLPKGVKIRPHADVTFYALGDIHVRQSVGPAAFYPGSPVQTAFDEDPDKGVLIVDTDDPKHPRFVPIHSRKFVMVLSSDTEKLKKLKGTDAHVKVEIDKTSKRGKTPDDLDDLNVVKTQHAKSNDVDITELKSGGALRIDLKRLLRRKHGLSPEEIRFGLKLLEEAPKEAT
jgi:DNA repair exonuclease SbcCD nuclease subunit